MTSSLIHPSYTIRATILEKVFRPEIFPKTGFLLGDWRYFFAAFYVLPPLTFCSVCPCIFFFIALFAIPGFAHDGKQALKKKIDRQKEGEIKCCKEISSPTLKNAWRNIPIKQIFWRDGLMDKWKGSLWKSYCKQSLQH